MERRPRGPWRGGCRPWMLGHRPQGLGSRAWPRCGVASRRRKGCAGLPASDPVACLSAESAYVGPSARATRGRRALDGAAGPRAPPQCAGSAKEEDKGPARYIPIKVYFLSTSSPELHAAAGSGLAEECTTLGGCRTGMTKMNNAYNLPAN